jgi:hypothetical protein
MWIVLTLLQLGTWTIQENLEAAAGGHRVPLLGVLGGAHWLAPVVQAEVGLVLATAYVLIHGRFRRRHSQVLALEGLEARRWVRCLASTPLPTGAMSVASTPLERWGAQRWQRPPPIAPVSI